tara:strand:+ start:3276 stop:4058 length:783 start_codon:yes stop_codon:yes gene_type:complete
VLKSKIKLVSAWTQPGGSTVAHINLTNLLNDNGYDCTFYGPHDWHLDKCKSNPLDKCVLEPDDILISHFIKVPDEVKVKQHILYCHEKDIFPLKNIPLAQYDLIVFVSNLQKKWHSVNHPSVIIPPLVNKVEWKNPNNKVAGVVGSIDKNKQTHISIERALKDGYKKVLLFGELTDMPYYNKTVAKLVRSGKAVMMGHEDEREALYKQVSEVYHSSLSETYGLVEAECKLSGIPFNGTSNGQEVLEKEEILERWKAILEL